MNGFLLWIIPTLVIGGAAFVWWLLHQSPDSAMAPIVGCAAITVAVLIIVVGIIRWATLAVETNACNAYHDATGRAVDLVDTGPIGWTCFVEVDGEWYPKSQVWSEVGR